MAAQIKPLDTVIMSNSHQSGFAGKIGFVMEVRNDNEQNETRFDIQFPFHYEKSSSTNYGRIFNQLQVGIDDITLLQSY